MNIYEQMKEFITRKMYALTEVQDILNSLLVKKQLTSEQYEELVDMTYEYIGQPQEDYSEQIMAILKQIADINTRLTALENGEPIEPPTPSEVQDWQPWNSIPHGMEGSVGIYMKGERVRHNGVIYESVIDNNIYEPASAGIDERIWKKIDA